ncbi:hypothetical protein H9P43_004231 [Blastocladiella emersonii ATCC 22665]|nr:hypothetical protein H9P43_004231 [Blastocladiella emersonii ATCC 22665]
MNATNEPAAKRRRTGDENVAVVVATSTTAAAPDAMDQDPTAPPSAPATAWDIFPVAKKYIDTQWERREGILKRSREVTREAKKMIVALQRFDIHDPTRHIRAAHASRQRIQGMLRETAAALQGAPEFFRFARNISPGLQEFLEAASFLEFLEHKRLLSYAAAKALVEDAGLLLTAEDYLLGVGDLTGEIMRLATSYASKREYDMVFGCCRFMQEFYHEFMSLWPSGEVRDFNKKVEVMRASVVKVETLCYALVVHQGEHFSTDTALGLGSEPITAE